MNLHFFVLLKFISEIIIFCVHLMRCSRNRVNSPTDIQQSKIVVKSTKRNEETKATLKHSLCVFSTLLSYKTLFLINISSHFIFYFSVERVLRIKNEDGLCRNVFFVHLIKLADYANFVFIVFF